MRPLTRQSLDKELSVLWCRLRVEGVITCCRTLKLSCIVGQNAALDTAESRVAELSTSFLRISKLLELHESEVEVLKHRSFDCDYTCTDVLLHELGEFEVGD